VKEFDPLPIWFVVILLWLRKRMLRRQAAAAGGVTTTDWRSYLVLLDLVFYDIPVPTNRFEIWLVRRLQEWIDREISNINILLRAGILMIGMVPVDDGPIVPRREMRS
jgi:hypothetical protein